MPKELCIWCERKIESGRPFTLHTKNCEAKNQQHNAIVENVHAAELVAAAALVAQAVDEPTPAPEPPSPPRLPPRLDNRPRRAIVLPARYRQDDAAPEPVSTVVAAAAPAHEDFADADGEGAPPATWVRTTPNRHGIYKVLVRPTTHDPDDTATLDSLCKSSNLSITQRPLLAKPSNTPWWFPFASATVARLMMWFHLGSSLKSIEDLDALITNVLLQDDFNREELRGFRAALGNKTLDEFKSSPDGMPVPDTWKRTSVRIKVPGKNVCTAEEEAVEFEVEGLVYRDLLDVMVENFSGPAFADYHTTPFVYRLDPAYDPADKMVLPDAPLDHAGLPPLPDDHTPVYGEVFASGRLRKMHSELPRSATPNIETIIAAYMFWSDATHLANFGNASLWPLYIFFGNQSKYSRARPTSNACHHTAYFPSLPDSIKDFYRQHFNVAPSAAILTHLKRELMHAIWDTLITAEFIHAYIHGHVVKLPTIPRKLFWQQFAISVAALAPRCFVSKDKIPDMGTSNDARRRQNTREDTTRYRRIIESARNFIYKLGRVITGTNVENLLKPQSWVPTRNAFSKLAAHGLNLFSLFVPDLLHEVELGTWKSLFTHLLRLLQSHGEEFIQRLDERFRLIPTFGRRTIRRFTANVSELKKLAARDWEDIVQCCLPVLEGLFPPEYEPLVLSLVYTFATFHAYAKLRMHTGITIVTFRITVDIVVFELPAEIRRRQRRDAKNKKTSEPTAKQKKSWNIATYKWHAMGDYADSIEEFGTLDSYSTQIGELAHRLCKILYGRTNRRGFEAQIATLERRRRILRGVQQNMHTATLSTNDAPSTTTNSPSDAVKPRTATKRSKIRTALLGEDETLPPTPPKEHHHISDSRRTWMDLTDMVDIVEDEPAFEASTLLAPLSLYSTALGRDSLINFDFTSLVGCWVPDRIFSHKYMRVNYTTYDCLRDADMVHATTRPDILMVSREDNPAHPYTYARVVSIFHAQVQHLASRSKDDRKAHHMYFLWVRFFERDTSKPGGWKYKRLHRIKFCGTSAEPSAGFGFVDPARVIRGVHLIPAFHYGKTDKFLAGPSILRHIHDDEDTDYEFYYVNQFADRDLFMRYAGDAVGHHTAELSPEDLGVELDNETQESDGEEEMDVDDKQMGTERDGDTPMDEDEEEEEEEINGSDEEDDQEGDDEEEQDFEALEGDCDDEDVYDAVGYDEL
ncbi:hypothetical protein FB45DRAFT_1082250 [Roridomyces roridus]|uniref:Uncharacterized protein n=1 Tax=Roridomyces roridus TaxID=1738132 RepID=A0AAD7BPP8_9AGAR|nr:hypothetical protein FB45DRAFT_1082250 [Roridomyces roridus]